MRKMRMKRKDARGTGQETRPTLSNEIENQTNGRLAYGTRAKQSDEIGKLYGRGLPCYVTFYATFGEVFGKTFA